MKKSPVIILAFLCSCALTGLAQTTLVFNRTNDQIRLIPISITGFSGEADSVLRFDLSVLGLEPTTLSEGLLEECTGIAARYRDRADLKKIISRSVWRAGMETSGDLLTELPVRE